MISPEVLRRFALFAGLEPEVFKDIAMFSNEVQIAAGDWIFRENDNANALYLIIDGHVDLMINLDSTGEKMAYLSSVVTGEVLGWSALVDPYAYTLGAQAKTDLSLVRINAEDLRELMQAETDTGYVLMQRLTKALGQRLTDLRVQFVSLTVA